MAGNSALRALSEGVYSDLTGDGTLMGLITGVYDTPPDGTAFPYVTLGDPFEERSNTFTKNHKDVVFMVDVWSTYQGYREAYLIVEEIVRVLDNATPTVTGYNVTDVSHVSTRPFKETTTINDRAVRHVNVEFLVMLSV